jgi:hypothetical protein
MKVLSLLCFFFLTDNSRGPSDGWTAGDYKRCYITTARETTFGLVFFRGSNKYATHGGLKVAKDATRVIHRPLISSRDFFLFLSPASLIITWTISFLPTTKKRNKSLGLTKSRKANTVVDKNAAEKSVVISHWKTRQKEVGVGKRVWGNWSSIDAAAISTHTQGPLRGKLPLRPSHSFSSLSLYSAV